MTIPQPTSPGMQAHPARELLARYKAILAAAWQARRELAGPTRLADETAFLPAALSLQATPVHPAPRRAAIVICALFAVALLWAWFGQVDIVAIAPGRIVVSERTKTIQPLDASVVKRVLVRDGDSVQAGQVLVELDATNARADQSSVQEQLKAADADLRRSKALLAALTGAHPAALLPLPPGEGWGEGKAHLQSEWQDIQARLAKLDAEYSRRQAEAATVREAIAKLDATIPLARQREADVKGLAEQGFMNQHAGQDRTRERIEMERDLATQRARLSEAAAASREAEQNKAAYLAETRRTLRERQTQATLKREQLGQERNKTEQRQRLTQLSAPVAGTVQQVAVHTEGGVVTPAQVLMVVVPRDAEVTAEVVIDNKDIGFVRPGQAVEVKLETFPFTRYGTVPATVKRMAADAVADEKRGAIFPATLTLARSSIDINGQRVALAPGMNLSAEIKTGRRRVADYLLSPIRQAANESLRER
ncbi:MAG: HlyD family type I secretion periplasmic adaptor subunit [Burkholderiaceae bacterium]|nr:HlyD family type I secretion periplasmic adaptor subunit [Burkholderiaceae bacterium]